MQILLANAKIMFGEADRKPLSAPLFQSVADTLAAEMARMDVENYSELFAVFCLSQGVL